jgi:hypothetical protein
MGAGAACRDGTYGLISGHLLRAFCFVSDCRSVRDGRDAVTGVALTFCYQII